MLLYKCGLAICVILILAGTAWVSAGPNANIYFTYSLLALMAFGLELADGSTMGFVFVILALPRLNGTETLLLAGSALFILAVVRRPQPSPKVLLQSLGAIGIAVLVAHGAYHAPVVAELRLAGRLVIASSACFAALHLFGRKRADLWSFPYYLLAAAMAALFPVSVALIPLLYLAWRSYRFYERRLERQCEQSRQAASLNLRTIETLAQAIEAKDQPLSGRSRRVQIYAVRMAQELRLPPLAVEALRTASLLYDIGELAVPEHIILKPGPLTPEEFEKMKTHAAVGAEILERVKFPYPVAPIVLAHHERWDGAGYPHGLKGEEIPIGARILAAIDALDALASPRQHRPALPLEEALERVAMDRGRAYDPKVVAVLRRRCKQWEKLAAAQPDGGFFQILSAQREEQILSNLIRTLGNSLDLDQTFAVLEPALRALIAFETLVVWVERGGHLEAEYAAGDHLALCSSLRIPAGGGVSGWVTTHGKPINNGDAWLDLAPRGIAPETSPFRLALSAPLRAAGVTGALTLYRSAERSFSIESARVVSAVAPKLSMAVANGLEFRRASTAAATDALTGLPNASALFARMAGLKAPTAVLVCDLDGFKLANDRFGHLAGNRVLETLAEGFRKSCRGGDFVARLGGDEFVLLLAEITREDLDGRIAHFREIVRAAGRSVCGEEVLDASFGSAFYPGDGVTADELLAFADRQMYSCKNSRKAKVLQMARRA